MNPILMIVKSQLENVYDKVQLDRKASHDNYLYFDADGEMVRVKMDNEDNDWWLQKQVDGQWKIVDVITI